MLVNEKTFGYVRTEALGFELTLRLPFLNASIASSTIKSWTELCKVQKFAKSRGEKEC